jgi:exopolysaccharide biosynthesis polyprenyl glycosylphosphotransferase
VKVILASIEAGFLVAASCAASWAGIGPAPAHLAAVGRSLVLAFCCVAAFYYNDLYDFRAPGSIAVLAARLPRALLTAALLLVVLDLLFPVIRIGVVPCLAGILAGGAALPLLRFLSNAVLSRRPFTERVLILGTSPLAESLVGEIESRDDARFRIVGVVAETAAPGAKGFPHPVLAPFDHLGRVLEGSRPDRVVVAMRERRGCLAVERLLEARMRGVLVQEGVEFYEGLTGKIAIESLTPSGVIFSGGYRPRPISRALARALGVLTSAAGLVALAPLFGLVALAIKLDSRGRVLFVQERVGRGGRKFRLLKFRTMHPAVAAHSEWARDNGRRITRVGAWLRKFRLDELPQFVNVLRGEMDLVGPRPHPLGNYDMFLAEVPFYALRGTVRPGLTGWAQVRYGYANNLEEETEKMRYDLYYIKHRSLALDLRILLETAKIVLLGRDHAGAEVHPARTPSAQPIAVPLRVRED